MQLDPSQIMLTPDSVGSFADFGGSMFGDAALYGSNPALGIANTALNAAMQPAGPSRAYGGAIYGAPIGGAGGPVITVASGEDSVATAIPDQDQSASGQMAMGQGAFSGGMGLWIVAGIFALLLVLIVASRRTA